MTPRCFQIRPSDTVATLLDDATPGQIQLLGGPASSSAIELVAREPIARGHKIALVDVPVGAEVIKFGVRIGHSLRPIARGDWVHLHNLASDLDQRSGHLDLHSGASSDNASAYA